MSTSFTARFDEPQFYLGNPHATFERLRHEDPLHWYAEGEFWVVTKYDDVRFISVRPERFSSERIGIMMDLIAHREGRDPHNFKQRGISFMDPPQHRSHRRAVQVHFTPAEVAKLDTRVRGVIADVFDALPDGEFDWISRVAEPIPVYIFAHMLGIPEADWPRVAGWATIIADAATGTIGGDHLQGDLRGDRAVPDRSHRSSNPPPRERSLDDADAGHGGWCAVRRPTGFELRPRIAGRGERDNPKPARWTRLLFTSPSASERTDLCRFIVWWTTRSRRHCAGGPRS